MTFLRKIIIFLTLLNSNLTFGQDLILIKGYVIAINRIQADVQVSVAQKKTSTFTDFKGRFKINCSIGDTLIFEKKYSDFKIEKYVVLDSLPIIIELINTQNVDKNGRYSVRGYTSKIGLEMPKFSIASSITDKNVFNFGYNFLPQPFFPDKPYIPILNNITLGANFIKNNNNYSIYPNVGFFIRNFYKSHYNSGFSFSFFATTVNIGYLINDFSFDKNRFGYELGLTMFDFTFRCCREHKHISVDLKYYNYITPNGTFMLSLTFKKVMKFNDIPKFIKKQIPR
jgi:hypothetical protein